VVGASTKIELLTGATDVDGDVLSLLGHTNPRHGTLSCGPDGRCSYTSAAGYAGADGFAYTVGEPPPTTAATPSGTRSALARPLGSPATATGTVRIEVVAPAAGRSSGGGGSLARTGTPVDRPWAPGIALLGLGLLLVAAVAADR